MKNVDATSNGNAVCETVCDGRGGFPDDSDSPDGEGDADGWRDWAVSDTTALGGSERQRVYYNRHASAARCRSGNLSRPA